MTIYFVAIFNFILVCLSFLETSYSFYTQIFGLLAVLYISHKKELSIINSSAYVITMIIFLIGIFYKIMFSYIDVPIYFSFFGNDVEFVSSYVAFFVQFSCIGIIFSQLLITPSKIKSVYGESRSVANIFLIISLFVILISLLNYIFIFRGVDYVEIHNAGGSGNKFVYLYYAATILLLMKFEDDKKIIKKVFFLLVIFSFVYGVLLKIRSPLFFTILIFVYFFAPKNDTLKNVIYIFIGVILMSFIPLLRDSSLIEQGVGTGFLAMILGAGFQADTLLFVRDIVNDKGSDIFYILKTLTGVEEPLPNFYTRSISMDYFNSGGGFGFFAVSDFFYSFGYWGALLVSMGCSFCLRSLEIVSGRYLSILLVSIYANSLNLVRNDVGSSFRATIYTVSSVILLLLFAKLARSVLNIKKIQ